MSVAFHHRPRRVRRGRPLPQDVPLHPVSRTRRAYVPLAAALALCAACSGAGESAERAGASTAPAAPAPAALGAAAEPVLGEFSCDEGGWNVSAGRMEYQPRGYFVLLPGGRYRWLDNGGQGAYEHDAGSGAITWRNGPLADKQPRLTTCRRNQTTTQVDIHFSYDVEWSCGHDLT